MNSNVHSTPAHVAGTRPFCERGKASLNFVSVNSILLVNKLNYKLVILLAMKHSKLVLTLFLADNGKSDEKHPSLLSLLA